MLKHLKKNKSFIVFFVGLLILLKICVFLLYKSSKKNEKKYIIIENGIKFFQIEESQKIIKLKPEKQEDFKNKKNTEYEIYKLPKYSKDSNKK